MRQLAWLTNRGEILTRDFLPGLTPYVRWLRTPLGSLGSAAVASALCGLFLHPQGFVVFFGLLVVIGPGPGLALAERARAVRLAGVRSGPLPRGGTGHGPDHPPQPDALGRLGRLDQGRIPPAGTGDGGDDDAPVRPGLRPRPADDRAVHRVRPRLPRRVSGRSAAAGLRVPVRPVGGVAAAGGRGAAAGLAAHVPRRAGARGGGRVRPPTAWRRATARATGATRWGSGPTAAAIRSAACTGACRRGTAS